MGMLRKPPPAPAGAMARANAHVRAVATTIANDKRTLAVRKELTAGYALFKKTLLKRDEIKQFRKNLPGWIARNSKYKAFAMDDDALCAFVAVAPFIVVFMVHIFFAIIRWLNNRDKSDLMDAVFGSAMRRQKISKKDVMKLVPNQAPARVERSKSGREILLTKKEGDAMNALRLKLERCAKDDPALLSSPELRAFVDDSCLCRYLRARKWKIDKALKMLVETLKWRATMKPESITWNDIANEAKTGKQYRSGRCKRERRVLVMRPDRENTFNHTENIKFLVYMLENILWKSRTEREARGSSADLAPEQIVILIDFTKWTRKVAVPMATARETLSILQNHYPERLGVAVCFNPPTIFRIFWSIISPFIDPKTYTKILFVNPKKKEKAAALMAAIFRVDAVDADMGGNVDPTWNYDDYAKHMIDYDAKRAAIIATWS